jgi:hypothetical protein
VLIKASCYVSREVKKRTRTMVELLKEAETWRFHGEGFGFVATDFLAISGA